MHFNYGLLVTNLQCHVHCMNIEFETKLISNNNLSRVTTIIIWMYYKCDQCVMLTLLYMFYVHYIIH